MKSLNIFTALTLCLSACASQPKKNLPAWRHAHVVFEAPLQATSQIYLEEVILNSLQDEGFQVSGSPSLSPHNKSLQNVWFIKKTPVTDGLSAHFNELPRESETSPIWKREFDANSKNRLFQLSLRADEKSGNFVLSLATQERGSKKAKRSLAVYQPGGQADGRNLWERIRFYISMNEARQKESPLNSSL